MQEKIKEVSNEYLLRIYQLVLEHLEFLENEKKKLEEVDKK